MNKIIDHDIFQRASASDLLLDLRGFGEYFSQIQFNRDFEVQTKFLKEYFSLNPMFKSLLYPCYFRCMVEYGNPKLALEICRIYVESCKQISDVGRQIYNLPLISESAAFVERIGELFDQASLTYLQRKLGIINSKPVLPLTPDSLKKMNNAALPYLEDCYEVVTEASEIAYYCKFAGYAPYVSFFYKYSDHQYGHNAGFSSDCYEDLLTNNISPYPFHLKDVTISRAMKFLKPYGLNLNDKFVVLHLREKGFADADQHSYRNCEPKLYEQAVKYFLDQGLKVIRIGHDKMTPMFEHPGFLDLTKVVRPDEVDIFVSARAQFYFGTASGPSSVSYNFGVPCCLIGLNTPGVRPNNFVQFLKFKDTKTSKILTFNDLDNLNLKLIVAPPPLTDRGLKPVFPTSDDNLNFAKEILEYFDQGKVFKLNEQYARQRQKHKILGGLDTRSLSLLD